MEKSVPDCAIKTPGRALRMLRSAIAGAFVLALAAAALSVATTRGDDVPDDLPDLTPAETKGSLLIVGGSERFDNEKIWDEFLELAGGSGARIAVIPTASDYPRKNGTDLVDHLNEMGAEAFLVPVAEEDFEIDVDDAVRDEKLVDQVRKAQGVFFIGGDQARIRDAFLTKDALPTPMLKAIREMHREGGVVGGSSAGAAIMSRIMYRDAYNVLGTMLRGVKFGFETDHGLGFLPRDWFVDQHFLVRGRLARSLVAMKTHGFPYGVGIDEDTALVVAGDGEARVVGYRGVVVMDLTDSTSDPAVEGFNLKNARLSYLGHGDTINLRTREITPSEEKLDDRRIDPSDPEFQPYFQGRLFFNDILGNSAILDMLSKLIDNRYDEGHGLAFDGPSARIGPTPGFEFRFYREKDSLGWNTEAGGSDEYTVLNIHLDVRPITIKGPLYD